MFVVLLKFNIYEVCSTDKTETNYTGRHKGESPPVIFRLCLDLGSSDLPSFINQNSFFMLPKNDERANTCKACGRPKEPIYPILEEFFSWQSARDVKSQLWLLFITAIGSDDMDESTSFDRSRLAMLYQQLSELTDQLEFIHNHNIPPNFKLN